jgi:C1A family cysteine protease
MKIKRYGWVADLPDHRDHIYSAPMQVVTSLPTKVDLSSQCPAVYDQGQLGSCTANAIAGAIEFDLMKEKKKDFMPSRLFIYYNERDIEGTVDSDSGAQIGMELKVLRVKETVPKMSGHMILVSLLKNPHRNAMLML